MQSLPNAKKETRKIRGTESESEHISHSDVDRQVRRTGDSQQSESLRTDRVNSKRRARERTITTHNKYSGGIVSQLIDEYRTQVAIKKQEIERLEARIEQFEAIQQEIDSVNNTE